jgi:hypothetical protein
MFKIILKKKTFFYLFSFLSGIYIFINLYTQYNNYILNDKKNILKLGKKVKSQNENKKFIEIINTNNKKITTKKKSTNNVSKEIQRFYATDGSDMFMQETSVQKCTQDIEVEKRTFRTNGKSDFTYFLDIVPSIRSGLEKYIMVYGMESVINYFI